jgi:hypothetical protein
MAFAVDAVVNPEVLPPMGKIFSKSLLRQQGDVKKGFQRERRSPITTATTALSPLFLYNYLKIKN